MSNDDLDTFIQEFVDAVQELYPKCVVDRWRVTRIPAPVPSSTLRLLPSAEALDLLYRQGRLPAPIDASLLGNGDALPLALPDHRPLNSATLPMMLSISSAIGVFSPVKVSLSLRNWTPIPFRSGQQLASGGQRSCDLAVRAKWTTIVSRCGDSWQSAANSL